jgi:hypothetical protein
MDRLCLGVRIVTFVAAVGIGAEVLWGLATGAKHIEPHSIAVWLFMCGLLAQLGLWLIRRAVQKA